MLKYAEHKPQISEFNKVWLCLPTTARLYALMKDSSYITDEPGAFLDFHTLWTESYVFELPFGYVRFEAYPLKRAATIHGIAESNPYYHTKTIKEVLNYYLEHDQQIDRLECHVPKKFRGIHKLVSSLATSVVDEGEKIVYHYWREQ